MTPDEIDEALTRGAWQAPSRPSPLQPIGMALRDAVSDCALSLARRHDLVDASGQLHCWGCQSPIEWTVTLSCPDCRAEERRTRNDRRRQEYLAQKAERARQPEQSRPQQRVAGRSFRDDY